MDAILKGIVDYGIAPVLFAAAIFIMVQFMKALKEQRNAITQQETRLTSMFDKMMEKVLQINHNTNTFHSPQEEEENKQVNLLIDAQLRKIQLATGANRVSCFQFHNGGKDMLGRSFQKMSMTHEVVDENTVPVMTTYQNVPRTMFAHMFDMLTTQGHYYIENLESIKSVDAVTYQSFYSRGTHSVFIQAIKTTAHVVLGFVVVEFSTSNYVDAEALKEELKSKTIRISGALELGSAFANAS